MCSTYIEYQRRVACLAEEIVHDKTMCVVRMMIYDLHVAGIVEHGFNARRGVEVTARLVALAVNRPEAIRSLGEGKGKELTHED